MNSKFLTSALIAVASLASAPAFAAGADNAPEQKSTFVSTQSRAEVRAGALNLQKGPVTASSQVDGGMTGATAPLASERGRNDMRAQSPRDTGLSYNPAPGRA